MKLLVDENIPRQTVHALRELGHDVLDVRGTDKQGISDSELWRIAQDQKRLLITTDRDFAVRRTESHFGMLIVCLRRPNLRRIHDRVIAGIEQCAEGEWPGALVMVRDVAQSVWRQRHQRSE